MSDIRPRFNTCQEDRFMFSLFRETAENNSAEIETALSFQTWIKN